MSNTFRKAESNSTNYRIYNFLRHVILTTKETNFEQIIRDIVQKLDWKLQKA
jgi:hypothetical protein